MQTTTFDDSASGTCTGRLNGVAVQDIPTVNVVSGTYDLTAQTATPLVG